MAILDASGIYMLVSSYRADAAQAAEVQAARLRAAAEAAKPKEPPPPAMIHPPAVATMLQSGTLIVVSKTSQTMHVFHKGMLWASTPVSTGKRHHETPSGVFPVLQKRKFHRSNIYSNAPMPFMQRLTWDGIALHAGRVPGYAASHGCVRMPHGFAQALFRLTSMDATTVVIGNDPLETDAEARHFALTASLPVRSALAPPPDPAAVHAALAERAVTMAAQMHTGLTGAARADPPLTRERQVPPPAVAGPANAPQPVAMPESGQTIQLTAAASQAEAEAYWVQLRDRRPDISRFEKRVEPAQVDTRRVYRLRLSGPDAHAFCITLKSEGIGCLAVG